VTAASAMAGVGAFGGLEFGIVAILVEHQVRGAVDVCVREHRVFLRRQNNTHEKGSLVKGRVITIGSNLQYLPKKYDDSSVDHPSGNELTHDLFKKIDS